MKLKTVYAKICEYCPISLAEDFDNVGLLLGDLNQDIGKVVLCLDVSNAVIDEAIALGTQLIISHHPIFMQLGDNITSDTAIGRKIIQLLNAKIAVISMHTNMDIADGGLNDILLEELGLTAVGTFSTCTNGREFKYGRIGLLKETMSVDDFASFVAKKLAIEHVQYVGDKPVKRIGIVSGGASQMYREALAAGCDTFITGEVKHSVFLSAYEQGINVLNAGHYHTERICVKGFRKLIETNFPDIEIFISKTNDHYIAKFSK